VGEEAGVERSVKPSGTALVVLAVLAVVGALYLFKAILIPVVLALVLACVLAPLTTLIRRLLPLGQTFAAVSILLG
jgi:predicted PurR-regulated permease PerM